jgi:hypothetical protein
MRDLGPTAEVLRRAAGFAVLSVVPIIAVLIAVLIAVHRFCGLFCAIYRIQDSAGLAKNYTVFAVGLAFLGWSERIEF